MLGAKSTSLPHTASVLKAKLLGEGVMFWDGPEGMLNQDGGKDIIAWAKTGLMTWLIDSSFTYIYKRRKLLTSLLCGAVSAIILMMLLVAGPSG
jgi:hypothetical protein